MYIFFFLIVIFFFKNVYKKILLSRDFCKHCCPSSQGFFFSLVEITSDRLSVVEKAGRKPNKYVYKGRLIACI